MRFNISPCVCTGINCLCHHFFSFGLISIQLIHIKCILNWYFNRPTREIYRNTSLSYLCCKNSLFTRIKSVSLQIGVFFSPNVLWYGVWKKQDPSPVVGDNDLIYGLIRLRGSVFPMCVRTLLTTFARDELIIILLQGTENQHTICDCCAWTKVTRHLEVKYRGQLRSREGRSGWNRRDIRKR